MATVAERIAMPERRPDFLSGTHRAHSIDRWIFVFMAAWFILIVLVGFVPSSIEKIAEIRAGERLPFPMVLHVHAVLMGSFLLMLLAQAWLVATGREGPHKQLGLVGVAMAVALIVVGFVLVPTNYHRVWEAAHSGAPGAAEKYSAALHFWENTMLMQIRDGLFAVFLAIGLVARSHDAGLHKRMIILATSVPLAAALARIHWLPTTAPASPLSSYLYVAGAASPMFIWDVIRNRRVHQAYWIWLAVLIPVAAITIALWDTPWWHATARQLMGY